MKISKHAIDRYLERVRPNTKITKSSRSYIRTVIYNALFDKFSTSNKDGYYLIRGNIYGAIENKTVVSVVVKNHFRSEFVRFTVIRHQEKRDSLQDKHHIISRKEKANRYNKKRNSKSQKGMWKSKGN